MLIFIAITSYKALTTKDLHHFLKIAKGIDGLLFRTPMSHEDLFHFITDLLKQGFPKDKAIIHSDIALLEKLNLSRLHMREMDTQAFDYKAQHPEIEISMSTHSLQSVTQAYEHHLDYVFYGHIFETPSKPNQTPRSIEEIHQVLQLPIPVYAIGGITKETIHDLPHGFAGVCAISFFMNASLTQIEQLRKEWLKDA